MSKIQVAIIGAGPSGLLLSQLLRVQGIESVVLERQTRAYVEARIRAGLLEWSTVDLLNEARAGARMMLEGLVHDGFELAFDGRKHRIDLKGLTGQRMMVYGQTEIQKDLADAHSASGGGVVWEAGAVALHDLNSRMPRVTYTQGGKQYQIECDFIAGCDGFHGVSRSSIPKNMITLHERVYPFGWIGILANVAPVTDELIYVNHRRGFSLCSMRSKSRSRYYLQCPLGDDIEKWPDERFWDELQMRLPHEYADNLIRGPSIEKSIAPLRSFVAEPMRFGQLFLVGDAAHIVPPTGAKGLNLAAADVRVLRDAILDYYRGGSETLLDEYSARALERVWKATRFSWWFTTLTHKFSEETFAHRMQLAELDYIAGSRAAAMTLAENYVGLSFAHRATSSPAACP
jgi:p-hydroxybenzoate 3-monooxygenase